MLGLIFPLFLKILYFHPVEYLSSFLTDCNSIETPFDDSDHSVSIDSNYYDASDFSKFSVIEKYSRRATLSLNIASLSKNSGYSQSFICLLLKNCFVFMGILKHKINKNAINFDLSLQGNTLCFNKTESFYRETKFFISGSLTFKQHPDL